MDGRSEAAMGSRFAKAVLLVVVLLLAVPGVQWVLDAFDGEEQAAPQEGVSVSVAADPDGDLAAAIAFAQELGFYGSIQMADSGSVSSQLPEGFEDETFVLSGAGEVFVVPGRNVVGYLTNGSASEAYSQCVMKLEKAGWTAVPSGQENQCTLVKESGTYRWMYVSSTGDGSTSAVVMTAESQQP